MTRVKFHPRQETTKDIASSNDEAQSNEDDGTPWEVQRRSDVWIRSSATPISHNFISQIEIPSGWPAVLFMGVLVIAAWTTTTVGRRYLLTWRSWKSRGSISCSHVSISNQRGYCGPTRENARQVPLDLIKGEREAQVVHVNHCRRVLRGLEFETREVM